MRRGVLKCAGETCACGGRGYCTELSGSPGGGVVARRPLSAPTITATTYYCFCSELDLA